MTGRLFGVEYEWGAGAGATLIELHRQGLAGSDRLHEYHCDCRTCEVDPSADTPDGRGYAFHGQRDCSCDGEIITRPIPYGSDEMTELLSAMQAAAIKARAVPNSNAGQHVHVDQRGMSYGDKVRLYRLFMRYQDDLDILARGRSASVRSYNDPMRLLDERWDYNLGRYVQGNSGFWTDDPDEVPSGSLPYGSWLRDHHHTMEFRLWNSTRAYWRTRGQVGVSVAMVEAAIAGATVTEHDPRPMEEVLGPWLDAETWAFIIRQRYDKGGIAA